MKAEHDIAGLKITYLEKLISSYSASVQNLRHLERECSEFNNKNNRESTGNNYGGSDHGKDFIL